MDFVAHERFGAQTRRARGGWYVRRKSGGPRAGSAETRRWRRGAGERAKEKEEKKPADSEADGAAESSKPMSAVDRAMAMLMGG